MAITARKKLEMQWQVSLVLLAQPVFDPDSAREKGQLVQDLMDQLADEVAEEDLTERDTLALLEMAGRKPFRKIENASTGDTSDNT